MKPLSPSPTVQVLTSADLLQRITAFQIGIPWPLYDFWLQYKGDSCVSVMYAFRESGPVVAKIVEHGSLDLLELAKRVCLPAKPTNIALGKRGRGRPADKFSARRVGLAKPAPTLTLNLHATTRFAIQFNRPDALEWGLIYDRDHGDHPDQKTPLVELWQLALSKCRDDTRMLDVLKCQAPMDLNSLQDLFSQEFMERNVETMVQLLWITTELPELHIHRSMLKAAAERGDLEMVQYLYERGDCGRCDVNTFSKCYHYRHWNMLEFLLEHDLVDVSIEVVREMIQDTHEPIQQLVSKFAPRFQSAYEVLVLNPIYIDRAAADGMLDVIKQVHERGIATATTDAVDEAAENEEWQVVEFLLKNRSEGCTERAMTAAAEQGNLELLRILHEYNAPCSTDVMDAAAAQGHLQLVKFLHEHRSEGCTVAAMNDAAKNGHLDVVQFLHENRTEGCTVDAMRGALQNHKPRVVEYLRHHYPRVIGPELLHDALLYGAFDLYLELRNDLPEEADAVVGDVAFEAGKELELPTIRFIVQVLKRIDVAHRAMDGAASGMCKSHLQWLRAVYAIAGDQSRRLSAVQNFVDYSRAGNWRDPNEALVFLVSVCCEDGALELVPDAARQRLSAGSISHGSSRTSEPLPLHSFLLNPRMPSWAIRAALDCQTWCPYRVHSQWALKAVYNDDVAMLEVLRDTPTSARPRHDCRGNELDPAEIDQHFSFSGARAVATRTGNLPILQWLFEHVDLPVEPTLLAVAVYYHRFDIAQWLVNNHPEACTETYWSSEMRVQWMSRGVDDELLDWLEAHDSVRSALDLGEIIDTTASNLADGLGLLHKRYPELVMARLNCMESARFIGIKYGASDTVAFLQELGFLKKAQ